MAVIALTDAVVFVDSHDFTGDSNQARLEVSVNELDVGVFGQSWKKVIGGTKDVSLNVAGFWQSAADSVDESAFTDLGVADRVVTIAHASTEESTAYILQAMNVNYSLLGQHGEAAPFTLNAAGSNAQGAIKGELALAKGDISATGAAGSGVQLGAVASDEYLYAVVHVFPTAGTTITFTVESDDNSGFTTATTQATFSAITSEGGTWVTRVAGAIADDYFRFNVTAVTGTFTCAGVIGVGS